MHRTLGSGLSSQHTAQRYQTSTTPLTIVPVTRVNLPACCLHPSWQTHCLGPGTVVHPGSHAPRTTLSVRLGVVLLLLPQQVDRTSQILIRPIPIALLCRPDCRAPVAHSPRRPKPHLAPYAVRPRRVRVQMRLTARGAVPIASLPRPPAVQPSPGVRRRQRACKPWRHIAASHVRRCPSCTRTCLLHRRLSCNVRLHLGLRMGVQRYSMLHARGVDSGPCPSVGHRGPGRRVDTTRPAGPVQHAEASPAGPKQPRFENQELLLVVQLRVGLVLTVVLLQLLMVLQLHGRHSVRQ